MISRTRIVAVAAAAALGGVSSSAAALDEAARAKVAVVGDGVGAVVGAADFCVGDGQALADLFLHSLSRMGFPAGEAAAVAARVDAERRRSLAAMTAEFAAKGIGRGQCPPVVVEKIRAALDETEVAWRRVVRNETGIELERPGSAAAVSVPVGSYACYTFTAGQLEYAFTDVVIQPAGRYAVGGSAGTYTLAPGGAMTFTGPMANTVGTFSVKRGGKPQIDLAFDGDVRAGMACTKTR